MALVLTGYEMTVTLKDKGQNVSNQRFALVADDFTEAAAAASAIMTDLTAVTDAVPVAQRISEVYEDNAPTLSSAGEVSTVAVVMARLNGTEEKWAAVKIPAPKDGLFAGAAGTKAYNQIDPADAALVAYLENFEYTAPNATLSDGENLADMSTPANINGKRTHRASRNG